MFQMGEDSILIAGRGCSGYSGRRCGGFSEPSDKGDVLLVLRRLLKYATRRHVVL